MKITKKLSLILILSFLFITTQISCDSKEQPTKSSEETQSEIESSNNTYFKYPVRDYPIGKSNDSKLYWDCSENDFGNYLSTYNGFHSGEDWNLKGGINGSIDLGEPVYSIGIGKVVKISPLGRNGSLGYLVAIEHSGNFVIPSKELSSGGQNASYREEKVNKIYSVYIHLKDIEVKENDNVNENSIIGYIMDPGGGPHLHFEIRHPDSIPSSNWSMVYGSSGEYDKSKNWRKFPDGGYNGYYIDLQKMVDAGLRDPSDFIEANYKSGEEYKGEEEVVEEVSGESEEEEIVEETTAKGKIAFASDRDGYGEIYIMNIDGSGQVNLTNNPKEDWDPSFSPDGSKIAFESNRDANCEIYIMNVDGSEQTRLTNNPAYDGDPCFSPDGNKIAFISDRDGNFKIHIMNVDGSGQVNLTNNPADPGGFSFSPDGSKIAFESWRDISEEIFIMNIDGSGQRRLTNNPEVDELPCFSPDGSKIAFTTDRDSYGDIYIMNIDGSGQVNLTNNPEEDRGTDPCFSPDGKKIAFGCYRDGNGEIYIMNVDGSGQVNLTNNPANDYSPCFSP